MGKYVNSSVLDAALDKVSTGTQLIVTAAQPTDRASAISNALASTSLTSGDFTKSAGTPDGRKLTVAEKSGIVVSATGNAGHMSIIDGTSLLWVTTVATQAISSGNTITIPAWTVSIANPV